MTEIERNIVQQEEIEQASLVNQTQPEPEPVQEQEPSPEQKQQASEKSQLVEQELPKLRPAQESPESASTPSHSLEEALSSTNSAPAQHQVNGNATNESLYDHPTVSTELKVKGKAFGLYNTVMNVSTMLLLHQHRPSLLGCRKRLCSHRISSQRS